MPTADRSLDIVAFVSEHFRDFLRRRLSELSGLALLTLTLLAAIALASWSVQDPSLSHATQKPIHNLLGYPGAIFADLAMQLFGLAAVMLLLPMMMIGWKLLTHRSFGEKRRALWWMLSTFLFAGFFATLPRIGTWPLPTGLGGVVGDAVLHLPRLIGLPLNLFVLIVLSPLLALAAATTAALGAGWRSAEKKTRRAVARDADEDDEDTGDEVEDTDRASAWLGMIVHALLSWKARIGRMLRKAPRAPMRDIVPAPSRRPARTALRRLRPRTAERPSRFMPTKKTTRKKRNRRRAAARPARARRCGARAAASRCPRSIC